MMGRPGSGRARKLSISFPRSATKSGAGEEERRQPGLDIFRDLVSGAVFGVAESAGAREALIGPGYVVGHAREGGAGHDRLVAGDLDQVVLRIDADVLAGRQ